MDQSKSAAWVKIAVLPQFMGIAPEQGMKETSLRHLFLETVKVGLPQVRHSHKVRKNQNRIGNNRLGAQKAQTQEARGKRSY
jgi:hypothetical protein